MQANDIVLCDGPCNRAYHFQCVQPAIQAAELQEDVGWLCPACDAKVPPPPRPSAPAHPALQGNCHNLCSPMHVCEGLLQPCLSTWYLEAPMPPQCNVRPLSN